LKPAPTIDTIHKWLFSKKTELIQKIEFL